MRSTSPTLVGIGPAASKAMSGLVAAKTTSAWSNRSAICSLRATRNSVGLPGRLRRVVVGGQVHADLDLGGEVVVAAGIPVAQLLDQPDQVGQRPLEAALGEFHDHVDPLQAGVADEGLGRLDDQGRHPGLDDGRPQVDRDDGPLAGQVDRAEPGLPPRHRGQAEGVAGVEAVGHVEPPGRVADRTGQAAERDGQRWLQGLRARGGCGRRWPSARTVR